MIVRFYLTILCVYINIYINYLIKKNELKYVDNNRHDDG